MNTSSRSESSHKLLVHLDTFFKAEKKETKLLSWVDWLGGSGVIKNFNRALPVPRHPGECGLGWAAGALVDRPLCLEILCIGGDSPQTWEG